MKKIYTTPTLHYTEMPSDSSFMTCSLSLNKDKNYGAKDNDILSSKRPTDFSEDSWE